MGRGDGAYASYGWDTADARLKDFLLDREDDAGNPRYADAEAVKAAIDADEVPQHERDFVWEVIWEDLVNDLQDDLMPRVQAASGHDGTWWRARVGNFGWDHSSGEMEAFSTEDAGELLRKVLPNTENSFFVFDRGDHITINNAHHDAPMGGEMYTIEPVGSYRVVTLLDEPDAYGDTESVYADEVWAKDAADAIEQALWYENREPLFRNVVPGPGDTATAEGLHGYPEKSWCRVRAERD